MTSETSIPERGDSPPRINAKAVAWALSTATICCLLVGVAAVEYLGRPSGPRQLEEDPEPIPQQPEAPNASRPTVLPTMGSTADSHGSGDANPFYAPIRKAEVPASNRRRTEKSASLPAAPRFQ